MSPRRTSDRGTFVTYGNVSSKPQYLPLAPLITKDITIRGFNLQRYFAEAAPADRAATVNAALKIANKLLLAVEPFADFEHALKRSQGECCCSSFIGCHVIGFFDCTAASTCVFQPFACCVAAPAEPAERKVVVKM